MIIKLALFYVLWSIFPMLRGLVSQTPATSAPPTTTAAPPTTAKMSAADLEQLLRSAPTSSQAPRDVSCRPLPIQDGWDYLCIYQSDVPPQPRTRLKIGVRVSANGIVQTSTPLPPGTRLVSPQPVAR